MRSKKLRKDLRYIKKGVVAMATWQELRKGFKPEFINRVDDIIVFHTLDDEDIKKIAKNMLKIFANRLSERDITVKFTTSLTEFIAKEGFDEKYGARPLRRVIQNYVEDFLAEKILSGEIKDGDCVTIDCKNGEVMIK